MVTKPSRSANSVSSTARKSAATTSRTAAKPTRATARPEPAQPPAPEPGAPTGQAEDDGTAEFRKKEMIDSVLARSGVKKKFAKPVIEAMIEVLGEAIGEGREINLQPMGKIKPQRTKDGPNARVVIAKIRQNKPGSAAPVSASAAGDKADGAPE